MNKLLKMQQTIHLNDIKQADKFLYLATRKNNGA